jgi:hypothetical protein
MNPFTIFGAIAAGLAVGTILGLIIFVVFDDAALEKRFTRLYHFLVVFTGLGGGSGVGFGFLSIELLPIYIGVASTGFLVVAGATLYLRLRGVIRSIKSMEAGYGVREEASKIIKKLCRFDGLQIHLQD